MLDVRAHTSRAARFGLVGATGLVVNTVVMGLFTSVAGLHYLVSAALATQASTTWNFVVSDRWVFTDRAHGRAPWPRFGMFWTMNNLTLPARGVIIWLLTEPVGAHYLLSNAMSLVLLMVARYGYSHTVIWKPAVGEPALRR